MSMTPSSGWYAWSSTVAVNASELCLLTTRWGGGLAKRSIRKSTQSRGAGFCFTGRDCDYCKRYRVDCPAYISIPI
ncbi:hypothetical protein D3C81_1637800 [compost metagenome]